MRSKDLDEAIVMLTRLLASNGAKPVHDGQLRKALREMKSLRRGGKLATRRVARVVNLVSQALYDEVFDSNV